MTLCLVMALNALKSRLKLNGRKEIYSLSNLASIRSEKRSGLNFSEVPLLGTFPTYSVQTGVLKP